MLSSFKCPVPGCDQTITIETNDDQSALDKLISATRDHFSVSHPNFQIPNNLPELMKSGMSSNGSSSQNP